MDAEQLYNKLQVNLQSKLLAKPTIRIAGLAIGGAWIAERLASDLGLPQYGVINVAFHRDDYAEKGLAAMRSAEGMATHLPFEVTGAHIVLIDDVMTTGATLSVIAQLLKDFGAQSVHNWVILRTPKKSSC